MYLAINFKHVLSSGMIGALVGIGSAILFIGIKYLFWKNRVPNWISRFRWVIGFGLGTIVCSIYFMLGGNTESGTLVVAAVCLGIGNTFKNDPQNTVEIDEEVDLRNVKDNSNDPFTNGFSGTLSNNLTYRVVNVVEKTSFWGEKKSVITVVFADNNTGDLYFSKSDKGYFLIYKNERVYYKTRESALESLHSYLSNNKILELDRYYIV